MSDAPRLSIIPGWVVTHPDMRGKDLQVLCVLGQNANRRHGWTRRSQVKIAEQLSCARSTVQSSINRLVEIGAVERREVVSESGRDSAHWYRVIYDAVPPAGYDFDAYQADEDQEIGPISDASGDAPPAGISAPPAAPGSAPPAGSGPAPRLNTSCLTPPAEQMRENARERGSAGSGEEDQRAISKAFKRWYPSWPTYVDDSEPKAFKAWLELSAEDRLIAVDRSEAYVAAVMASGRKYICSAQVYLAEKRWEKLPEKASADARKAVQSGGRVTVTVLGPTWAAAAFVPLLGKPVPVRLPDDHRSRVAAAYEIRARSNAQRALAYLSAKGITIGADGGLVFPDGFERAEERLLRMEDGYPETKRLYEAAKDRSAVSLDQRFDALKGAMEFVPIDSAMMEAWRDYYAAWFLPMPPIGTRGGFFPKGGPEALDAFRHAVEAVMASEGMSDDAA